MSTGDLHTPLPMQTDDYIRQLLTRIFHETGHKVARHDPIIVSYVAQRLMLYDFRDEEKKLLTQFSEQTLSELRADIKKLEAESDWLMERSKTAAEEFVKKAKDDFASHVRDIIREANKTISSELNTLGAVFFASQDRRLKLMEKTHQDFMNIASRFRRTALFLGMAALAGAVAFTATHWLII